MPFGRWPLEEKTTCLRDLTMGREERRCCTPSWALAKSITSTPLNGSQIYSVVFLLIPLINWNNFFPTTGLLRLLDKTFQKKKNMWFTGCLPRIGPGKPDPIAKTHVLAA